MIDILHHKNPHLACRWIWHFICKKTSKIEKKSMSFTHAFILNFFSQILLTKMEYHRVCS